MEVEAWISLPVKGLSAKTRHFNILSFTSNGQKYEVLFDAQAWHGVPGIHLGYKKDFLLWTRSWNVRIRFLAMFFFAGSGSQAFIYDFSSCLCILSDELSLWITTTRWLVRLVKLERFILRSLFSLFGKPRWVQHSVIGQDQSSLEAYLVPFRLNRTGSGLPPLPPKLI